MEQPQILRRLEQLKSEYLKERKQRFFGLMGMAGGICGAVVERFITHSHITVLFGLVGGLLVAFFIGAAFRVGEEDEAPGDRGG